MHYFFAATVISCLLPAFALAEDAIPDTIARHELTPQRYHITPDTLPAPYASSSATNGPDVIELPASGEPALNFPAGFNVSVFAKELNQPRWLAVTPDGDLLVTETYRHRILLLAGIDENGHPQTISEFATRENGLKKPFGMAFSNDSFFVGNTDAVLRFPYKKGQKRIEGQGVKIADLPGERNHWTRDVHVSADGQWLFVSVGSATNADPERLPRASIIRMRLDGSESSTYAYGLRNPTGQFVHPVTGALYTTVNERDGLGDDLVPDYFTQVQEGGFYGWPYAYLVPNKLDPRLTGDDGKSLAPELAAKTITPQVLLAAHSAPMQPAFTSGTMFPEQYRNGAFLSLRGSWNRNQGTGYKIVFIPFTKDNQPAGAYEDFLTGFLLQPYVPRTWGRPVGLAFLPDGSMVFADEPNGRIYRVTYEMPAKK